MMTYALSSSNYYKCAVKCMINCEEYLRHFLMAKLLSVLAFASMLCFFNRKSLLLKNVMLDIFEMLQSF